MCVFTSLWRAHLLRHMFAHKIRASLFVVSVGTAVSRRRCTPSYRPSEAENGDWPFTSAPPSKAALHSVGLERSVGLKVVRSGVRLAQGPETLSTGRDIFWIFFFSITCPFHALTGPAGTL